MSRRFRLVDCRSQTICLYALLSASLSGPSIALLVEHDAIPVVVPELLGALPSGEDEELAAGWSVENSLFTSGMFESICRFFFFVSFPSIPCGPVLKGRRLPTGLYYVLIID